MHATSCSRRCTTNGLRGEDSVDSVLAVVVVGRGSAAVVDKGTAEDRRDLEGCLLINLSGCIFGKCNLKKFMTSVWSVMDF